jgi:nucleotidyltransferase/DNA polymerase involved in DNA repair
VANLSPSAVLASGASSRPRATRPGAFHNAVRVGAEHTPIIEPLSLDEAYLDVTLNLKGIASATEIAADVRAKIRRETKLTASAGVSYNKFLAKLASDHRKPDGLFVITPKMGSAFVENLPVAKFQGVGPATLSKPPLSLKIDKNFIEQLAADLGRMAIAGLNSLDRLRPD